MPRITLTLLLALLACTTGLGQDLDVINGCPLQGNARQADNKRLNIQKNRYDLPAPSTRYRRIELEAILGRGPDANRFPEGIPAEMVGFVRLVKEGSKETCNCHETDDPFTDTHIELVPGEGPVLNHPRRAVIVEVSPRLREIKRLEGVDWGTKTLKSEIEHKWVRVRGWLLYDHEHTENADATNPRGKRIYKGGNWEIHPITDIKVISPPPGRSGPKPFVGLVAEPSEPTSGDVPLDEDASLLEPVIEQRPARGRSRRRSR